MSNLKAVSLLSGGLDSTIATQLILNQGIVVHGINFHSPFCTCNSGSKLHPCSAAHLAKKLKVPIKILPKGDDYLKLILNPRFGYGKNMNPCIDCRIYILKKAKEYADQIGAGFLITGEVLGQRPKSQTLNALKIIDEESGLKGLIVRPLSAGLLPPTIPEMNGVVHRDELLKIQGRRRNTQVEIGRRYKLIESYCAGGGCLLTDKNFCKKLKDYFHHASRLRMADILYLKIGRHYRYNGIKIISGRNEIENKKITAWARENDVLLELRDIEGPTTLIFSPGSQLDLEFAAQVTIRYSDSKNQDHHVTILNENRKFHDFNCMRDSSININLYRIM